MTLSSTAEGSHKQMEPYLDQMVDGIVGFLKDPVRSILIYLLFCNKASICCLKHPRVRYAACNCIGQMATDFAPSFQKKFQAKVTNLKLTF